MIQVNGSTTTENMQSSASAEAAEDELVRLIAQNEERLKAQNAQVSALDSGRFTSDGVVVMGVPYCVYLTGEILGLIQL